MSDATGSGSRPEVWRLSNTDLVATAQARQRALYRSQAEQYFC